MKLLTGFQPTGRLHLGNYLGAIRPIVDLQNTLPPETDIFVFIADLHTLSEPMKAGMLRKNCIEMATALIACGIDTNRVTLFRQSRIPAHAELALLLSGMPRIGQLARMTQFKDKSAGVGENSEGPRLALFTYPVLQAADILLYQTTHVPVGDDQRQHLQLTREIARKFNHDHARKDPVFTIPDPMISEQGALTWAINKNRETGQLSATCFKNIAECIDHSDYQSQRDELALDFGLNNLFASNEGDLWGRQFYKVLKRYDRTITQIAKHVQRSGGKPRESKRYRQKVTSLKAYIKCEINRILNRVVSLKKPPVLILESLDFQNAGLTKRLNRILQNCGRGVIRTKLASLEEQFGIQIIEVNPAYTSQECSSCDYIDKRNRNQSRFQCRFCGTSIHSDVNGARNLPARRSCRATEGGRKTPIRFQRRKDTLTALVRQFNERVLPTGKRSRCSATPDDPRLSNPYFKDSLILASLSDGKLRSLTAA